MRLINPGAGDYADRLTIVTLKLLFGGDDTTHFRNERNAIVTKLANRNLTSAAMEALVDLAAVNGALWHAEDDLREWRDRWAPRGPDETGIRTPGEGYVAATAQRIAQLAFRIQELNDRRSALRQTINKELGDHIGEEKVLP